MRLLHLSQFILIVLLTALVYQASLIAQVSGGTTPFSFSTASTSAALSTDLPTITMPDFDLAALQVEDALNDLDKSNAYRFGKEFTVDISLEDGLWETLPNGDRIWRLRIHSKYANTINLIYEHFYMPPGASLHLYNNEGSSLLGAFTEVNNKPYQMFSTGLTFGPYCILEYYEPAEQIGQGIINIQTVVHGYRGFGTDTEQLAKGFNDSGACNINVNCPSADDWEAQKRSVALILSGGFRICTGAMINNVNDDCRPLFLTANHCLDSTPVTEAWMFMFNYESPNCDNIDGETDQTVSGCTILANGNASDFALLELSIPPPPDYNVFLAGFNAVNDPASANTGIHHPAGDIKKICFDEDEAVSSGYFGGGNNHWRVVWEDGTTEGGSSGSPLFDQDQRITGQLHGGGASCFAMSEPDFYGKLSYSWDNSSNPSSQLKVHLDPDDTGTEVIDGRFCSESDFNIDASILEVISPEAAYCFDPLVTPVIRIRNSGNDVINQLLLIFQVDGGPFQSFSWEGEIEFFESVNISLPTQYVGIGEHTLNISIQSVNGLVDENYDNNDISFTFINALGSYVNVELLTDDFAEETSYQIFTESGDLVYSEGNFSLDNELYENEYCLPAGCYEFVINDSYGDGICCGQGNGSYEVFLADGTSVASGGNFSTSESTSFCVEGPTPTDLGLIITASDNTVCLGETVDLTAFHDNANEFVWSVIGGNAEIENNFTDNPTLSFTSAGTYTISLLAWNEAGSQEITQTDFITVSESPVIAINAVNAANPISNNGSAEVNIISGQAPFEYNWSHTDQNFAALNGLAPGEYTITVTDAGGCATSSSLFISSDIPPIESTISADYTTICTGSEVSFTASSNNTASNINWSFEGGFPATAQTETAVVRYDTEGVYEVSLNMSDEYTTSEQTLTAYIEVLAPPSVQISTTAATEGNNDASIIVNVEELDSAPTISGPNDLSFVGYQAEFNGLSDDTYTITVNQADGCTYTETVSIGPQIGGVDESGLSVYPNPAVGSINIYNANPTEQEIRFDLFDLNGKQVFSGASLITGVNTFDFDAGSLATGVYVVRLTNNGKEARCEKIIFMNE